MSFFLTEILQHTDTIKMSGEKIVVNDEEHNLSFDLVLVEVCLYVAGTSDLMKRTESWRMHLHDQGLVLGLAFLGKLEILKFNSILN